MTLPPSLRNPFLHWTNIVPLDREVVASKPDLKRLPYRFKINNRTLADADPTFWNRHPSDNPRKR